MAAAGIWQKQVISISAATDVRHYFRMNAIFNGTSHAYRTYSCNAESATQMFAKVLHVFVEATAYKLHMNWQERQFLNTTYYGSNYANNYTKALGEY